MKGLDALDHLESLASDQWGIITTAQAEREGVSRLQLSRLAERGTLERVRRGVYLLPSAGYGPLTDIRVAWVSLEPGLFPLERLTADEAIYVSHESAALIHGIGDLIPTRQTFSATGRKQTSQKDIRIHNHRSVSPGDTTDVEGLAVSSIGRTIADLAETRIEFNYLATAVTDALRKEGVRIRDLAKRLDPSAPVYGFQTGADLLQACQVESPSDEDRKEEFHRFLSGVLESPHLTPAVPLQEMTESSALADEVLANAVRKQIAEMVADGQLERMLRQVLKAQFDMLDVTRTDGMWNHSQIRWET